MKQKWQQLILMSGIMLFLTACGQSGPLYLPDQPLQKNQDAQR